jgi:cation diffusion facilitator CzcD-associated flavoprotein CzcO
MIISSWKWPDIPGLETFKGHMAHSARWDESYSFNDKAVAVIGSGSSAIQIVPKIQPSWSTLYSEHLHSLTREQLLRA